MERRLGAARRPASRRCSTDGSATDRWYRPCCCAEAKGLAVTISIEDLAAATIPSSTATTTCCGRCATWSATTSTALRHRGSARTRTHTDLPRLRAGGVGAQFWSVFVPTPGAASASVTATLEQVDAAYAMIGRYADQLALATTADEVEAAWRSGRIACLMGAEGGHQIAESLARAADVPPARRPLPDPHPQRQRARGPTRPPTSPVLGGLTDVGREVVAEMNRIGMIVDLSHVSHDVMRARARRRDGAGGLLATPRRTPCATTRATCPTTCSPGWPTTAAPAW